MPEDPEESYVIHALHERARAVAPKAEGPPADDCAILPDGTALTVDAMVEGVHFDHRLTPADVGWKLVAVNASDLAACGARPAWGLLALSLPAPLDRAWVDAFAEGFAEGLAAFGVALQGGDTTRSPGPRVASLSAGGRLAAAPLLRSGGRPGDVIWVSGTLGDAALSFQRGAPEVGVDALARPRPPIALGPALAVRGLATAAMDLSDGLGRDLHRLAAASHVGARVERDALPTSARLAAARRAGLDTLPLQVGWGEDYELLFTARPADSDAVRALTSDLGVRVSPVGRLLPPGAVALDSGDWPSPWSHFPPSPRDGGRAR